MENNLVAIPSQRPEYISEILSSLKRYDASIIRDLQSYLDQQFDESFQDLNSNLALLKLYEISGFDDDNDGEDDDEDDENEIYSVKALVKGLINFHYNDFELYLNLLPSYVIINEQEPYIDSFNAKVAKLVSIYKLLTTGKFLKFWALFESDAELLRIFKDITSVDNLRVEFQKSIGAIVSISNKSIKSETLAKLLHMSDAAKLNEFASAQGWTLRDDVFVIDEQQDQLVSITNENIKLEQITRLIKKTIEL